MKFTVIALFVFMANLGFGQTISKKDIRGTYERSFGDPAKTIQKGDSSYISIPYMEYNREVLKLKWFGKLTLEEISSTLKGTAPQRGKWKLENGVVILELNGKTLKYNFRLPVYLESTEGKRGFTKKID
tara:strand:+ start:2292 stop:2678 length:387 start_codon:yes stop_codon:yes gene_type:complete